MPYTPNVEPKTNWWELYHNMLAEGRYMPWDVNRLTIPLLLCIAHKEPPGSQKLANASDYLAIIKARQDAEKEWSESP